MIDINTVFRKDLDDICEKSSIPFSEFDGRNILITGATGLIGFHIASAFLHYGQHSGNGPKVTAVVRNPEKAKAMFAGFEGTNLKFIVSDIKESFTAEGEVDYIIHAASLTESRAFVNEPVETIHTAVWGTANLLELAKRKKVKSFVYLSSMEVYGTPDTDDKITENHGTDLNTMVVRTSYPESKRLCESMCRAYAGEYHIPVKVVRLTQTFGPGVTYDDSRVFAQFARCVIENKDIVLHTKGETKRSYLYTADAVTAILTVLLKGNNGTAYNAAKEETYCSIYEMARLVACKCAEGKIKVVIRQEDTEQFGYAPVLKMNLDTQKLRNLGWSPKVDLEDMFSRLCESMRGNRKE